MKKSRMKMNTLIEFPLSGNFMLSVNFKFVTRILRLLNVEYSGVVKLKMLASHLDYDIERFVKSCKDCAKNSNNYYIFLPYPWLRLYWGSLPALVCWYWTNWKHLLIGFCWFVFCMLDSSNAFQFKAPEIVKYFLDNGIKHHTSKVLLNELFRL